MGIGIHHIHSLGITPGNTNCKYSPPRFPRTTSYALTLPVGAGAQPIRRPTRSACP
jgi:hypothetical protein